MNRVHARLRLLACALLIVVPAISQAQRIILPVFTTPTPQLVAPASNATINGAAPNATNVTFVWRESGLFSYGTVRLPAYFIICLRLATEPQTCSWSNATWSEAVGAIPHSTYNAPGMPIGNPVGYQYTWQPPSTVTDTYLDRAVNWIVGACTSANPTSSCVLSAPQAIWFSAQDLVGENTGARPHPSSMTFRANASNAGTTRTPPFTANFSVYQVLLDNFNHCRTDANSPDVVNDPNVFAITINGFVAPFAALPRTATGQIDTSSIVGLHRVGLFTSWMPINVNPGLPASSPPTELLEWDVPTSTRPMGLATILALDTTSAVREQNEGNNLNVECNVAQ